MPLFHFVIDDGADHPALDPVILSSTQVARVQAVRTAAQVLDDKRDRACDGEPVVVTVEDESGVRVCTVTIIVTAEASNIRHLPIRPR
jgi:hypothetical protein